ncbi:glutamate racemase [Parasporobacterium paucivorans]|uniref:Glutamate racemase n=1 Tax=Parasporobacterium paucivorans DSM 15970 TaxID=1122934 RepID=A0A1M6BES7_9FIRM|nr:glutamate racemase [Parasporobacterium paucivorans]SHI47177.1 glutamate racemase [Parasporobacterium paucivorans DSM 15970]
MKTENERANPIGVFDSGVGGLTVVREIMRQLPGEKIIYFGDTARVPYGSKSKETITKYSRQIIRFLKTKNVKAIVIACNTASAYALEDIKNEIDIPIMGVIEPGARAAAMTTANKRIGIIGTEATIASGIYSEFIKKILTDAKVAGKACPLFVPLVEEGYTDDPVTTEIASRYLKDLKQENIDTLILGCTHYPLLRKTIADIMGSGVSLVNPAYETATQLREMLMKEGLMAEEKLDEESGKYEIFVSDTTKKFEDFARTILPSDFDSIRKINIEEY